MNSQILRDNIIFWSRLGMGYDPPVIGDDGLAVLYDESFGELGFHQSMYKSGIRIHSFILNSGWIGDGKGRCIYQKLVDGRIHYLNNFPYADADSLKPIVADCGCHIYCDGDCVLHGDNRFLTVTTGKNGYSGLIDFGKERKWQSVSGGNAEKGKSTYVSLKPYETAMFIYE